ncbi:MAPEG family protein [bacterium (Candidatus Blackallbacteria) CG17_big_fil_post_rev_8_21_14_2_50_48_46]|uniref:Microsomal glutathione S-transferase 1 n=1 Tax=bacterium (Candidatus Blackallbacteria) CG17_big_fil_post_rev_8_21_14_2_50_48_46 TaxID=2014261 RepID=A0A2M7G5D2_9BACT|nr:MAG: MAPEG family protein [bacterium (Candidatus Blackallbacteria) CG18_big_fil_WC_8_21_14_2_50_49_26]PIW17204.1 MAG: MAPEG family protein [bacterium (Candidatus Blackallbacteria) CG17_big_fil_post_rev_8_21_14_2_50_48_46]PIW50995.1 MAG: MAPEG family protein [bacterium (Candidatus Blackallbacteria) CG13_big_fil_rev_8_21_14_2_50_49_14]
MSVLTLASSPYGLSQTALPTAGTTVPVTNDAQALKAQIAEYGLILDPLGVKILAACTALLFFKMFSIGIVQGLTRRKHKSYTVPEDAAFIGKVTPVESEHPDMLRANNAYRNDLENIPIFLGLAWAFLALHCWDQAAPILFGLFTLGRFGHTFFYLKGMQPWRSLAFGVGLLTNATLAFQILWAVLR